MRCVLLANLRCVCLFVQLAELEQLIASEKKKKDGMDHLVGFYANDPKQQKQVKGEIDDLEKLLIGLQAKHAIVQSQLSLGE